MTHELRNTREAIDEERPNEAADHFLPPRAVADLIEHALPDLCMARDHGRHPFRAHQLKTIVEQLETLRDQYRSEHHT